MLKNEASSYFREVVFEAGDTSKEGADRSFFIRHYKFTRTGLPSSMLGIGDALVPSGRVTFRQISKASYCLFHQFPPRISASLYSGLMRRPHIELSPASWLMIGASTENKKWVPSAYNTTDED